MPVKNGRRRAAGEGASPFEEMTRSYQRTTRRSTWRTRVNPCLVAVSAVVTVFFSWAVAAQQRLPIHRMQAQKSAYNTQISKMGKLSSALNDLKSFMEGAGPFMYQGGMVMSSMILLLVAGLIGAALSINRIAAVDPMIALGREQ